MFSEISPERYFQITTPIDNFYCVSNCLSVRGATEDDCDYTVTPNQQTDDNSNVGEWYGVISLRSISSMHNIVTSNYCVSLFTSQLLWPQHWYKVDRL